MVCGYGAAHRVLDLFSLREIDDVEYEQGGLTQSAGSHACDCSCDSKTGWQCVRKALRRSSGVRRCVAFINACSAGSASFDCIYGALIAKLALCKQSCTPRAPTLTTSKHPNPV